MKFKLSQEKKEVLKQSWPALLTAAAYVPAFPSLGIWPLAFLCMAPTIALCVKAPTLKRAFWFAFVAGFFSYVGKLYWLVYTINHYGHFPLPLAVLIQFLLCAAMGTFWATAFVAMRWLMDKGKVPLWLAFTMSWMTHEWVLTWILTGFPWDLLGHCLTGWLPMAQAADLIGGIGLSFPVAFGSVVTYEVYRFIRKQREKFPVVQTAVLCVMVLSMAVYGVVRMKQIDALGEKGDTIRIGMLQGNVDQNKKWNKKYKRQTFRRYKNQAMKTVADGAQLVLMPETALPYWQEQNSKLNWDHRGFLSGLNAWVLLATPSLVSNPEEPEWPYKYNSVALVSPEGDVKTWYNKHRLVPFGEYLPLKKLSVPLVKWLRGFPSLAKLRLSAGFYVGEDYVVFPLPNAPFGIAICYEIVYPAHVRKVARIGAKFMVTITNDAWFGDTSAPHQHWEQVAMRAIEVRRWFARSANTGISGIIDANGRTIMATDTYVETAVAGDVRTMDVKSLYLRFGDWFLYLCVIIFAVLAARTYYFVRRDKKKGAKNHGIRN